MLNIDVTKVDLLCSDGKDPVMTKVRGKIAGRGQSTCCSRGGG